MVDFIGIKKQKDRIRLSVDDGIKRVLDHGKFIMGPEVNILEEELIKYVGVKNCISCSSGTDALLMSLMALDIKRGDAVLSLIHI